MPLTYEIDETCGIITISLSGELVGSDIYEYLEVSRKDPAYRQDMHRLVVAHEVASFPQLPEVRAITTQTRTSAFPDPNIRIAAVAQTPLGLGMIAMFFGYWGLADRYEVFPDIAAARAWLIADTN